MIFKLLSRIYTCGGIRPDHKKQGLKRMFFVVFLCVFLCVFFFDFDRLVIYGTPFQTSDIASVFLLHRSAEN